YLISALLLDFIIRLQFSPTLPVHHTPFSFFFTAPPTPEFYTLSLHDALPISVSAALAASHQRLQRLTDSSVLFIPLLIPFQLLALDCLEPTASVRGGGPLAELLVRGGGTQLVLAVVRQLPRQPVS